MSSNGIGAGAELTLKQRNKAIVQLYTSGKYTTEYIAKLYAITPRSVQRIVRAAGVIRTQAEANKIAAPLKNYHHVPIELRVQRKHISRKQRYLILAKQPWCTICGARASDGIRIEVDHIDNNPLNNSKDNLQVLCGPCNQGKSHADRFGS